MPGRLRNLRLLAFILGIALVEPGRAEEVLAAWRAHPLGERAAIIGEVTESPRGRVVLHKRVRGERLVEMLSGEQLPRIC